MWLGGACGLCAMCGMAVCCCAECALHGDGEDGFVARGRVVRLWEFVVYLVFRSTAVSVSIGVGLATIARSDGSPPPPSVLPRT